MGFKCPRLPSGKARERVPPPPALPCHQCCLFVGAILPVRVFACMHGSEVSACLMSTEDGIGRPGPRVTDGCESPYGCCEWNPGPQLRQPVVLTNRRAIFPAPPLFIALAQEIKLVPTNF